MKNVKFVDCARRQYKLSKLMLSVIENGDMTALLCFFQHPGVKVNDQRLPPSRKAAFLDSIFLDFGVLLLLNAGIDLTVKDSTAAGLSIVYYILLWNILTRRPEKWSGLKKHVYVVRDDIQNIPLQ